MRSISVLLLLLTLSSVYPTTVMGALLNDDEASPWSVHARLVGIFPDSEITSVTIPGVGSVPVDENADLFTSNFSGEIAANLAITNHFGIEMGIAFFQYSSSETQAAETTTVTTTTTTNVDDSSLSLIPITAILQYYPAPYGQITPYIGAGWHFTLLNEDTSSTQTLTFDGDSSGLVVQAGFDWWSETGWGFNFDIKKLFMPITGELTAASGLTGAGIDVDLDPLMVGAGIAYRF